jgi:hypothetical protein
MRSRQRVVGALVLAVALLSCGRAGGTGATAPDLAEVACETDATRVLTGSVKVQPDGVHVEVDNRTDRPVYLHHRYDGRELNVQNLPPGLSEVVIQEGPGSWEVICSSPDRYPADDAAWVPLDVSDPDGIWVSDRLACEHSTNTHPDYVEDFEGGTPPGTPGDPVELARDAIAGGAFEVLPDDVLERAGYPDALPVQVRLVRDGRIIAVQYFAQAEGGGWIDRGVDFCDEV